MKGVWVSVAPETVTVGWPPWRIQVSIISPTGSPEAASSAAQVARHGVP